MDRDVCRRFRSLQVLGMAAMLVVAGCRQKAPEEPSSLSAASRLPGCQAALARVDYGNVFVVPDDSKALIESYRTTWKAFCDPEQQGRPSLADLLVQAKDIELRFDDISEAYHASRKSSAPSRSEDEAASRLLVEQYPSFVPAFEGSYFEYEFFKPSFQVFAKHTPLGRAEDRVFFEVGKRLDLGFPRDGRWKPPWLQFTWDYGGCLRFGEFRWADALSGIVKLKRDLRSDVYLKMASDWEAQMIDALAEESRVCTCGKKDAVLDDLNAAVSYVQTEPALAAYLPRLQAKRQSIQDKKIRVDSEAERHCSGG